MLHKIKYDVTFELTGRNLSNEIDFEKGFGTITGPNESGKSFILEMIRWLLFGTAALRGSMSDYKKLTGELTYSVRGVKYTVSRTMTNAALKLSDKVIAVGTKPVNVKITQLFGFGLDVFDMSCVVNQMELVKLGQMRPADRKRMVDSVIGLGVVDDLTAFASSLMNDASKEANLLKDMIVPPVEPVQPEGVHSMEDIQQEYDNHMELKNRLGYLRGRTSTVMTAPELPDPTTLPEVEVLKKGQAEWSKKVNLLNELEAKLVSKPSISKEEIDEMEKLAIQDQAFRLAQSWLFAHPVPPRFEDELKKIREAQFKYALHQEWKTMVQTVVRLKENGTHTCPKCGEVSFLDQKQIDDLELKLAVFPSYASESVPLYHIDVDAELEKVNEFRQIEDEWNERSAVVPPSKPPFGSLHDVERYRTQWEKYEACQGDANRAEAIHQELAVEPEWYKMLLERQAYDEKLTSYSKAMELFKEWQRAYVLDKDEILRIEIKLSEQVGITERYEAAKLYESDMIRYKRYLIKFDEQIAKVIQKETEADDWRKAKAGLVDFRTRVKQHLIPSLNVAASALIRQMTGGQRQRIEVDDEFEVKVDNQPLHTLSGSGMVVANLALRLGLGRVLTNGVFSVFIGDEIDSSMDSVREKNTAQTMRNLCGKVSQVLLITHKYPEADYYIELGNTHDQEQS